MTQEFSADRPRRAPTHPGAMLREIVLPALNMSVTDAAKHLRITRQQLHRVLAEDSAVSCEMAIRLGKFCGNGPDLWIRMQEAYDLWQAKKRLAREVRRIPTFADGLTSM
jgi:addiction module HigA family antidote